MFNSSFPTPGVMTRLNVMTNTPEWLNPNTGQWIATDAVGSQKHPAASVISLTGHPSGYYWIIINGVATRVFINLSRLNVLTNTSEWLNPTTGLWIAYGLRGTLTNPAISLASLAGHVSGYYWVLINGVATNVFCDLSDATPWMLLMKTALTSSVFVYSSSYWTNGETGLNDISDITIATTDIKNGPLWNNFTITNLRLTGSLTSTAYNVNPLIFGTFSHTANGIFSSGNNVFAAQVPQTRAQWLAWTLATTGKPVSDFDNQPNCNAGGINSYLVRVGMPFNNENDCGTNDSCVGMGAGGGIGTPGGPLGSVAGAGTGGFASLTWGTRTVTTNGWLWCR